MRAQFTHPRTALTRRSLYTTLFAALLMTSLVLGVAAHSRAESATFHFVTFHADLTYINPGEYELSGYINAVDPTTLTIDISGAVSDSTTPDSTGYYSLIVLSPGGGNVIATAVENGDTATASAELPEEV